MYTRRSLLILLLLLASPLAVWAALPAGGVDPADDVQEIARWIQEGQDATAPGPESRFAWPAPGYTAITSDFGFRLHPVLRRPRLHAGIDIGAPEGAEAAACFDGVVIATGELPAYGRVVVLDHGRGLASVYAHLSEISVREGDLVRCGDEIGRVGATGQVTGPHLHFEVWRDGRPLDPLGLPNIAVLLY